MCFTFHIHFEHAKLTTNTTSHSIHCNRLLASYNSRNNPFCNIFIYYSTISVPIVERPVRYRTSLIACPGWYPFGVRSFVFCNKLIFANSLFIFIFLFITKRQLFSLIIIQLFCLCLVLFDISTGSAALLR